MLASHQPGRERSMHLDREALYDFLLGKLESHQNREVVRHLLTGCETCRKVSREVWEGVQVPDDIDLSAIAAQVWKQGRAFDRERDAAPDLLVELEELTPERQVLMARNSPRFQTRALCELLCQESIAACASDAELAVQRATVATLLADELPRGQYGRGVVNDVQARAWSVLGHAQRAANRPFDADDCFAKAKSLLADGSGDPCQIGRVWYLEAILRHRPAALRRGAEALPGRGAGVRRRARPGRLRPDRPGADAA